ncbi:MAG: YggT family protein [Gracilibacteraceae bacterium]|nr:YggT family protein [Gracilibacteraceae bacterium]
MILLIFARVVISWLPIDRNNQLVGLLHQVTEPILKPFRFAQVGMMDFSPFLALILIEILNKIVVGGLYRLFY